MDALQTPEDQDREAQRQDSAPIEPQQKWEDVYAGYVIKEDKPEGYYIGPNGEMYRVFLRRMAHRFTKQQALDYIENGCFCKEGGPYIVEDAT